MGGDSPGPRSIVRETPYDVAIIGAGIIGLATARALHFSRPELSLVVLEKESAVATHQSGRNSGVVHTGIYYPPGSLKARLCVEGGRELATFCREHDLPYRRCGKILVASRPSDLPVLDHLFERGKANGVPGLRRLSAVELRDLQPHVVGLEALEVPGAAVVDYGAIARTFAEELSQGGVPVLTHTEVLGSDSSGEHTMLLTTSVSVRTRFVVNCGGLYADVIALRLKDRPNARIIPFRGDYMALEPKARHLVNGLVYPVPDPALPFLGAHFTPTVTGEVKVGPTAVLAFAREGYGGEIDGRELWDMIRWKGFRALARRHWRTAVGEYGRSLRRKAFLRSLRKLVPELQDDHLVPAPSGVRAQAVAPDGTLIDDFSIVSTERAVHVLNAPSPAATASIAIGRHVAAMIPGLDRQRLSRKYL